MSPDRSPVNGADPGPSLADWLLEQAERDERVAGDVASAAMARAVRALVDLCTEQLEVPTLTGGNIVRLLVPRSAGTKSALACLALAYAHRPGYREEWAP